MVHGLSSRLMCFWNLGFGFFFPPSSRIASCLSSWGFGFFLGGVVAAPICRAFGKVLARALRARGKRQRAGAKGGEELERNLLFMRWRPLAFSLAFKWRPCFFGWCGWMMQISKPAATRVSFSSEWDCLCFLLAKLECVRSRVGGG